MRRLLGRSADASWHGFASSWDDLGTDLYMADGGRYRCRRYAAFKHTGGRCVRKHQPHYQSPDYNPPNGDIERRFEPVLAATAEHAVTQAIFEVCTHPVEAAQANLYAANPASILNQIFGRLGIPPDSRRSEPL